MLYHSSSADIPETGMTNQVNLFKPRRYVIRIEIKKLSASILIDFVSDSILIYGGIFLKWLFNLNLLSYVIEKKFLDLKIMKNRT